MKSQSYWGGVHRWPLSKGRRKTEGGARRACLLLGRDMKYAHGERALLGV